MGIEVGHFYLVFIYVVKVFRILDGLISLMLSSHMMRALRAAERICFFSTGSREKLQSNSGLLFAFLRAGK